MFAVRHKLMSCSRRSNRGCQSPQVHLPSLIDTINIQIEELKGEKQTSTSVNEIRVRRKWAEAMTPD